MRLNTKSDKIGRVVCLHACIWHAFTCVLTRVYSDAASLLGGFNRVAAAPRRPASLSGPRYDGGALNGDISPSAFRLRMMPRTRPTTQTKKI